MKLKDYFEEQHILYWIYDDTQHVDPKTEGYIGITTEYNFDQRMKNHAYKGEFSPDCSVKVIAKTDDLDDINDLEKMYRPKMNIGWNKAAGGGNRRRKCTRL